MSSQNPKIDLSKLRLKNVFENNKDHISDFYYTDRKRLKRFCAVQLNGEEYESEENEEYDDIEDLLNNEELNNEIYEDRDMNAPNEDDGEIDNLDDIDDGVIRDYINDN